MRENRPTGAAQPRIEVRGYTRPSLRDEEARIDGPGSRGGAVRFIALGGLLGLVAIGGFGSEVNDRAETFAGRIDVTAVSVMLDVRDLNGDVPGDLTASDFEVREDGVPQTILAVEPLALDSRSAAEAQSPAGDWQVVIYFDQKLASRRGSREAALSLAAAADDLTRLGPVQILAADAEIEEILPPTRDSEELRSALERAAKKVRGHEELVKLRRQFLRDLSGGTTEQEQIVAISGSSNRGAGGQGLVDRTADGEARERMLIRASMRQEVEIVGRQSELITRWAKRDRRPGARLLVMIHDGFDVEPRDFYLGMASSGIESAMSSEMLELSFGPLRQRMTRLLVAQGWTVLPLAVGRLQSAGVNTVEEGGAAGASNTDRLGIMRRAPSFIQGQTLAPLRSLAAESGGQLLTDEGAVGGALQRLAEAVRLDYQVARPPDGKIHQLEVVAKRPGLNVKFRRWVASETLEEVAISRAQRLAEGSEERGDLPLASMVLIRDEKGRGKASTKAPAAKRQGTLATRVDLSPLADLRPMLSAAAVRVSLVIFFSDQPPFVHHQILEGQDLSQGEEWKHALTMTFPAETAKVVVVVEELATGSWGGAVAPLVRRKVLG